MVVIKHPALRRLLRVVIPFLCIPLVVLVGAVASEEKRYLFVSFCVVALATILFLTGFEKKLVGSRRMVLVAVMTALCVVGRMLPIFKPVTAVVVIAALYLGGEAGFLVGALAALVSNFYFGQGPWTPFQMLALGMIGLMAGYVSTPLKNSRLLLVGYGVLSGIVYSMILDVWTVLWYHGEFSLSLYLAATVTALPHTALYAVSNGAFLWCLRKPIGDKLERIRVKYGI